MRQETYRGFTITSEHEGEGGEVTGHTVAVDTEAASAATGEEVGSMAGGFPTVTDARAFIDGELDGVGVSVPDSLTWRQVSDRQEHGAELRHVSGNYHDLKDSDGFVTRLCFDPLRHVFRIISDGKE